MSIFKIRKTDKRKELKALDDLFSQYIRMRAIQRVGGCERCLTEKHDLQKDDGSIFPAWKQLQCSHFHGRSSKSVRFDEDNCVGLCGGCHRYLEHHPLEHVNWFRDYLGSDRFDLLEARTRIYEKPDVKAITIYLKHRLDRLKE